MGAPQINAPGHPYFQVGNVLDATSFGALGNGVHDDTAAIQKAINAAANVSGAAGVVYLPAGVYMTSAPLITTSDVNNEAIRFRGDGRSKSIVKLANNSNCDMIQTPDDGVQRYHFEIVDLKLMGNAAHQTTGNILNIRGMNELLLDNVAIYEPKVNGIYIGQATPGIFNTVPMITNTILRGDNVNTTGNGIDLDSGSSDSLLNNVDIGFFSNGAGILYSAHPGFGISNVNCWQNKYGYQLFGANRGRFVNCLSDLAKQHGFISQNSNDLQLANCQARESSQSAANTYDGFFFEGTSVPNTAKNINLTACKAMGAQARYGVNLNQNINGISITGDDYANNQTGTIRIGTAIVNLTKWDATPLVTDASGNTLFGFDSSGRPIFSVFTASATAGANGAVPAQVQGYITINIGGSPFKVPYYNI